MLVLSLDGPAEDIFVESETSAYFEKPRFDSATGEAWLPIASPGMDALRAVAFPADTPYYYFRALCDGSGRHAFAETY